MPFRSVLIAATLLILVIDSVAAEQVKITKVEQMTNHPRPYFMRDWAKVARDYDAFVFDFDKQGDYLPLIWWDKTRINADRDGFGMPSYVGRDSQSGANHHEAINCMGAVLGATLVGVDKSKQNGHNWVLMCDNYFSRSNGLNLYLNNIPGATGNTFWYETLPNVLFLMLRYHYPGTGDMDRQMDIVARRWYDACIAMGGKVEPWTVPNFNHTSFDFAKMKPVDNGTWLEPDSAAAIGWIEYMAWVETKNSDYLNAADWCVQFLDQRDENPLYDVLLCYGAYLAARMNAELGRSYDAHKLINWCFEGRKHTDGVLAEKWGDYDVSGLYSTVGYAFNLETLHFAGALTPIVRYDDRYARAIGKYMLNVANNVRMFYPNALPKTHQTCADWAKKYDPAACIGYEGLKKTFTAYDKAQSDQKTAYGTVKRGSYADTLTRNNIHQVLEETTVDNYDALEHVWRIPLTNGDFHQVVVKSHIEDGGDKDSGFRYSWAAAQSGPYKELFTIGADKDEFKWRLVNEAKGAFYLKVEDTDRTPGDASHDLLCIDEIYVETRDSSVTPYASGDPLTWGWGETDLGLYGSAYVGILGGIVKTTNVKEILQLDLLATDYYHDAAYPTYLYFNPHGRAKNVQISLPEGKKDLYETTNDRFIAKGVSGSATVTIPANSARVTVICPAGAAVEYRGSRTAVNGVIVDYDNQRSLKN